MSTPDLRAQLVQIDASIAEHKLSLKGLEGDKLAVTAELRSRASFPVLTLPVEITTAIFAFCLPTVKELRENYEARLRNTPPTPTAPNVLAGCCRTWRDIAFATPFLWTTLPLCLRDEDFGTATTARALSDQGNGRADEYVDRWLGRAGLQPLTFVLCLEQQSEADLDVPSPIRCMKAVIPRYADRLQELQLEFTAACFDIRVMELDSIHFPLLERATLVNTDPYQDVGPASSVFGNAPRLHEFTLDSGTWLLSYTLPWTQLTKFEGDISDTTIFSKAPNLLEAVCIGIGYRGDTQVVHPCLQSLTFLGSDASGVAFVLGQLTLPALLTLRILPPVAAKTKDRDRGLWMISLRSLFPHSVPPLHTLCVNVENHSFSSWESILNAFDATLETLELHSPSDDFIYGILRLGLLPKWRCRLSRLQSLSILRSPAPNPQHLINFLYRRSTSAKLAPLQSFGLVYHPGVLFPVPEELTTRQYQSASGRRWCFSATNRMFATSGIDLRVERGKTSLVSWVREPGE